MAVADSLSLAHTTMGPSWESRRQRAFMMGLLPALIVLAAITIAPAIYLVVTSLTPLNLTNPGTAGDFSDPARNYVEAFNDHRFIHSVIIQVQLSVATVITQLLIGLGVALLLHARSSILNFIRTAFLVPMVLPPIVVALIWKVIYTPDISPMHRALNFFGLPISSLITNPDTALWAIAFAETWEWFPFTMLMVLATLQTIPDEPIEAAKIDGASSLQLFWHVTLPYLRGTLVVAGLFRLIDSIKAFPLIYVLTNGGPGSATEVTNYYAFVQAFNFSVWGYASAIATLMVIGVFLASWMIARLGGDPAFHE